MIKNLTRLQRRCFKCLVLVSIATMLAAWGWMFFGMPAAVLWGTGLTGMGLLAGIVAVDVFGPGNESVFEDGNKP